MPKLAHHPSADLRARLCVLESERALAGLEGLTDNRTYMADLEDEIQGVRAAYVGSAVTEIATLHGIVDGRNFG